MTKIALQPKQQKGKRTRTRTPQIYKLPPQLIPTITTTPPLPSNQLSPTSILLPLSFPAPLSQPHLHNHTLPPHLHNNNSNLPHPIPTRHLRPYSLPSPTTSRITFPPLLSIQPHPCPPLSFPFFLSTTLPLIPSHITPQAQATSLPRPSSPRPSPTHISSDRQAISISTASTTAHAPPTPTPHAHQHQHAIAIPVATLTCTFSPQLDFTCSKT